MVPFSEIGSVAWLAVFYHSTPHAKSLQALRQGEELLKRCIVLRITSVNCLCTEKYLCNTRNPFSITNATPHKACLLCCDSTGSAVFYKTRVLNMI